MNYRRLVGIDLEIATAHTARVLDGEGAVIAKRKAWPTAESLGEVERAALGGCPDGTKLEVVIEPTGPAWLPVAVFFTRGGTWCSGSPRRRPPTCAGSCPGTPSPTGSTPTPWPGCRWWTRGLQPLVLPDAGQAALDRRVRATDRLTRQAAEHKRRIKDLAASCCR
jgi:hypothetical protein